MEPLLYLTHRIPYPPNKGDKVRSFHILKFLATRYKVYLGCFADNAGELAYAEDLGRYCREIKLIPLHPKIARLKSLSGFMTGSALTLPYYWSEDLWAWVREIVARERVSKSVVFCSAMVQYVERLSGIWRVVDFVDVDSQKWMEYAQKRRWPLSLVFRREGMRLLAYECHAARLAEASFFATEAEAALFKTLAPEASSRVSFFNNGVDTDFFSPAHSSVSPFAPGEWPVVFTGVMDYWPNIDAVQWFANEIFPSIRQEIPEAVFYIVGMNPAPAVRALAELRGVRVTGAVPDIRPFTKYAGVVVAPLRVARGIQNKVLEAMAMAKPVVVSKAAAEGLAGLNGNEIRVAGTVPDFIQAVLQIKNADSSMGCAARRGVIERYNWDKNLESLQTSLKSSSPEPMEITGAAKGSRG